MPQMTKKEGRTTVFNIGNRSARSTSGKSKRLEDPLMYADVANYLSVQKAAYLILQDTLK